MSTFYLAAAALAAVALALLLRPWWQARRTRTSATQLALNTAIYKDQLAELERDRAAGQLAEADYASARDELQRRLLTDTAATPAPAGVLREGRATALVLLLALPLLGGGLYALIGKPEAVLSPEQQERQAAANMEQMVGELSRRLEAQPDNLDGWNMLARTYVAMGRIDDAVKSMEKIGPQLEQNASLMASMAELLLQQSKGDFNGRPRELIQKALKLEPENGHALFLAGGDAFQHQQYGIAVKFWERLLKQLEPGSEDAEAISATLEEARARLSPAQRAKVGAGGTAIDATKTLSGRIELSPSLAAKVKPDDVLFVFARAEGGPPMPLAALKLKAADLPYSFSLSDANALGGAKLSQAAAVRIEAKIAKGGTPSTMPGDLIGKSTVVKPGAKNLRIVIDSEAK